jgi:hypothetical protein
MGCHIDVLRLHTLPYLHHDDIGALMQVHSIYKDPCAYVLLEVRGQSSFQYRSGKELVPWSFDWLVATLSDDDVETISGLQVTKDQAFAALSAASRAGYLRVAKWLVDTYKLSPADDAFCQACYNGQLHVAKWILSTFGVSRGERRNADLKRVAYNKGHLETVKWLASMEEFSGGTVDPSVFVDVCRNTTLEVVLWFCKAERGSVSLSTLLVREAFIAACENKKDPRVVLWVLRAFRSTLMASIDDLFDLACKHGTLVTITKVFEQFAPTNIQSAAWMVALYGDQASVIWFYSTFDVTEKDVGNAFGAACGSGSIHLATWLASRFKVSKATYLNTALQKACENGHMATVRWLTREFKPIFQETYCALHAACIHGQLNVAKMLTREFNLTDDATTDRRLTFSHICGMGHLETAKWFHETFGITSEEVRREMCEPLRQACQYGHIHVAKWLKYTFDIDARDVQRTQIFKTTCHAGHIDTAHWLKETFDLTIVDARGIKTPIYLVAKWLTRTFNVMDIDYFYIPMSKYIKIAGTCISRWGILASMAGKLYYST